MLNKNTVPEILNNIIDKKEYLKTIQYSITKTKFNSIITVYTSIIIILFFSTGLFELWTNKINNLNIYFIFKGYFFFFIPILILNISSLPFEYYYSFAIEQKYGFNKYTIKTWIIDILKNILVETLVLLIVLGLTFYFIDNTIEFKLINLIIMWIVTFILLFIFMYIVPKILLPFFYKLKPIEDRNLMNKIYDLVEKSGFKIKSIFTADESKRSSHSNAAFTGIGKSKTIIIFDTMLEKFSHNEILAVLAHEIGHGKKKHIIKLTGIMIFLLFLFEFIAYYILTNQTFYNFIGINKNVYAGLFILTIFYFYVILEFLKPLINIISRKFEFEADNFSKKVMGTPEYLINTFYKFIKNDLAAVCVHPLYETFNYTHPQLITRIKHLEEE
jgi:STE24 endopeptidase